MTVMPTHMTGVSSDNEVLHTCYWVLELAQHFDLGTMKAPDEPEWEALMGK